MNKNPYSSDRQVAAYNSGYEHAEANNADLSSNPHQPLNGSDAMAWEHGFSDNPKTQERIKVLHGEKSKLLDQFGIFGGGELVNRMHQAINSKLELLGIGENG